MEIIALMTAMADARSAIQFTTQEMRNYRRRASRDTVDDILATLNGCNELLAVVQVHLSYLVGADSLLQVPGTNADNKEILIADYWDISTLFQGMMSDVRNSPEDFEWENATEIISERQEMIQERFANTLAAFGVEVWSWGFTCIRLSTADRDELTSQVQSDLAVAQSSSRELSHALDSAMQSVYERLQELIEE